MVLLALVRTVRRLRANRLGGIVCVLAMLLACILGNSLAFYYFDRSYHDQLTFGDALWYSIISITTIGYGDFSAQSFGARLSTIVFIVFLGLSTFSVFFGIILDMAADRLDRGKKGLGSVLANNHVVIVNFPSESRVRQLIEEICAESGVDTEIVIVADDIEELPLKETNLAFIRGSTHDADTYQRAHAGTARIAIVLSKDYSDANSDALVAAAVSVIDKINPDVQIVAECLDMRHRPLFDAVRCDAIVPALHISGNLLVQEAHDPGVSLMVEVITSNQRGATLYSTAVEDCKQTTYREFAKYLLDKDINLLAFNRDGNSMTEFTDHTLKTGDRLIYTANHRYRWPDLQQA